MSPLNLANIVGYVAASLTTFSFIPQIVKIRRRGGQDLSYAMLSIYLAGLMLWLAYGVMLHASAVIAANVASGILIVLAIVMKATYSPPVTKVPPSSAETADCVGS